MANKEQNSHIEQNSRFPDRLNISPVDETPGEWVLNSDFLYFTGGETVISKPFPLRIRSARPILVPTGFHTNFASVPRALWAIFPPYGRYGKAAVVHDFLYSTHESVSDFSRKQCDQVFLEAMKALNVAFWRRQAMYRAVRFFGWLKFRKEND